MFLHAHPGMLPSNSMTEFCLMEIFLIKQIKIYKEMSHCKYLSIDTEIPEILKYRVGVQRGQSYLMGRRCLFSLE